MDVRAGSTLPPVIRQTVERKLLQNSIFQIKMGNPGANDNWLDGNSFLHFTARNTRKYLSLVFTKIQPKVCSITLLKYQITLKRTISHLLTAVFPTRILIHTLDDQRNFRKGLIVTFILLQTWTNISHCFRWGQISSSTYRQPGASLSSLPMQSSAPYLLCSVVMAPESYFSISSEPGAGFRFTELM